MSTLSPLQAYTHKVAVVVGDTEDVVDEVAEVDVAAEVDEEQKGQGPETAHIAEWITTLPKTAGSVKRIRTNNSKCSHANMHEMPAVMIMLSSAIIVVKPVICAMNAN